MRRALNEPQILQGIFLTGEPIAAVVNPRARAIQPKAARAGTPPSPVRAGAVQPKPGTVGSLGASPAPVPVRRTPLQPAPADAPPMMALSAPTTAQLRETGPSRSSSPRQSADEQQQDSVIRSGGETAWLMSTAPPRGHGQPLPPLVQARMESLFGVSFADVRVHVGHHVSSVGALAYTHGSNLHFAPGQYNPHSLEGLKLLAHELTHVVQQREGRVKNPFGEGTAIVANRALEAEADGRALEIAKGPPLLLWRPDQPTGGTSERDGHQGERARGRSQPVDFR